MRKMLVIVSRILAVQSYKVTVQMMKPARIVLSYSDFIHVCCCIMQIFSSILITHFANTKVTSAS